MKTTEEPIRQAEWLTLDPDESVKGWSHPSIIKYLPFFLMAGALILSGLFIPFIIDTQYSILIGLGVIFMGGLLLIAEYARYVTIFYILTTERAIRKKGILSHDVRKIHYSEVQRTNKENPLIGRALNFGNVSFVTASPDDDDMDMSFVPSPNEVTSIYSQYKE